MNNEYLTTQEALLSLDIDMNDVMDTYDKELVDLVSREINMQPALYSLLSSAKDDPSMIYSVCHYWAQLHKSEFGMLFITELDDTNWKKVAKRI